MERNPDELYEKLYVLGKGGFGSVYKAVERTTGRIVAIKEMNLQSSIPMNKLRMEVKTLKELNMPQTTQFYESFIYEKRLYIVMEHVNGANIGEILYNDGRTPVKLPENLCAHILQQMLVAIEEMHNRGIVHRDIKPQNVLISDDGMVKLADFGIVAQLSQDHTHANTQIGTPQYMAPEVFTGTGTRTSADIWSIGIVAYEMACGVCPFQLKGKNHIAVSREIVRNDAPTLNPSLYSPAFVDFVLCCLQKNPDHRYPARDLLKHQFLLRSVTKKNKASLTRVIRRCPTYVRNQQRAYDTTPFVDEINVQPTKEKAESFFKFEETAEITAPSPMGSKAELPMIPHRNTMLSMKNLDEDIDDEGESEENVAEHFANVNIPTVIFNKHILKKKPLLDIMIESLEELGEGSPINEHTAIQTIILQLHQLSNSNSKFTVGFLSKIMDKVKESRTNSAEINILKHVMNSSE
ncbi:hypothetical protein PCE1_004494 [Barthelona sp. PCE]